MSWWRERALLASLVHSGWRHTPTSISALCPTTIPEWGEVSSGASKAGLRSVSSVEAPYRFCPSPQCVHCQCMNTLIDWWGACYQVNPPLQTTSRSMTVMEGPAPKLLFLLYIAGVTERIERVCRPLGIWVICNYSGKMREALMKVKQHTPELYIIQEGSSYEGKSYEVSCGECNHLYVGETEGLWGINSPRTQNNSEEVQHQKWHYGTHLEVCQSGKSYTKPCL